jgi:hypothetical protein
MIAMNRPGRLKQGDMSQVAEIVAFCTIFIFITAVVFGLF